MDVNLQTVMLKCIFFSYRGTTIFSLVFTEHITERIFTVQSDKIELNSIVFRVSIV